MISTNVLVPCRARVNASIHINTKVKTTTTKNPQADLVGIAAPNHSAVCSQIFQLLIRLTHLIYLGRGMKRGGCGYVCTVGWGGGWGREGGRERERERERELDGH